MHQSERGSQIMRYRTEFNLSHGTSYLCDPNVYLSRSSNRNALQAHGALFYSNDTVICQNHQSESKRGHEETPYQVIESDITSDIAHKKFSQWLKVKQIFPEKK